MNHNYAFVTQGQILPRFPSLMLPTGPGLHPAVDGESRGRPQDVGLLAPFPWGCAAAVLALESWVALVPKPPVEMGAKAF